MNPRHLPRPFVPFNAATLGFTPSAAKTVAANPLGFIPVFFLSGFFYFLFSRILDFTLSSLHLPLVFSVICLIFALAGNLGRALSTTVMHLLLGLTFWMMICTPFSVWIGGSIEMLKEEWSKSLMAGFIVVALVQTSNHAVRLMKTLAFAFLTAGILGFFVGESQNGRLMLSEGAYSNPNDYATAILYGCVCWYFMLANPRSSVFMRIFSFFALGLLFFLLLKTGSRGAAITLGLTSILVFLNLSNFKKFLGILLAPVLLAGMLFVLPPEMRNRYQTFFSDDLIQSSVSAAEQEMLIQAQGSSMQRMQLAKDALRLTLQNPIFGVGPGMFAVGQNELNVLINKKKGAWLGTHNSYLQVSSETGIPGLLLFLGCLFISWRDLLGLERDTKKRSDANAKQIQTLAFSLRLLLMASMIFFCFEHIPFSPFVPVLTCLIAALCRAAKQELGDQMAESRRLSNASLGVR